uniref:ATP synthase subunit a n=1 Tax=Synura synuroidea TaxID=47573 RepID=Q9MG86_9STRA|nr:ATP synthase F0 subunit 6 [Synura synuroidea]AAF36963.1 ATP synthase F0 subunit 6 [Synura synuroidea]
MIIFSPLQQFEILPLVNLYFGFFDFSITNSFVITILFFVISFIFIFILSDFKNNNIYIFFSRWGIILNDLYLLIIGLVIDNIGLKDGAKFFPIVFSVFLFILGLNIIGLIPYSFTVTSHFVMTFSFSFFLFLSINIITFLNHGLKFFSLFLPGGTSIVLAFLLVPIEMISYFFRPISLSIRLFANMMAGHTLLKVIAGFVLTIMTLNGVYFIFHYLPLFMLVPLFLLEVGVALIQAFVFSILISMYINSAINLH